jgi:hypothetical protein
VVQADVTYQFHVNGQEVTGSRLSFFDVRQGEEQDAAFVVKSLPVGKSVEVFYNSHEPTDCALSRSLAGRPLYLGLLLLPFHLVMVASWRWAVRKHRGVRDLPMRLEGDRWIVRRAHGSPIVVALIAASVLDLGEIVVLNSTNLSTNIVATSLAWLILIGLTWLAYRHTWSSARSEPPALIADNIARTLSWPTAGSDQTVAVAQLHAVELDETVTTTANGDVNVDFAVIVKYGADDGQIMTRSVLMTTNGHEAEILVDWLEDWTGLKQS